MEGNVREYLIKMAPGLPAEIMSQETYSKLDKMTALFRDFAASSYILETHLNTEAAEVDFSFRVLAEEKACLINGLNNKSFYQLSSDQVWLRIINFVNCWPWSIEDIWFEMDYGQCDRQLPQPCFFFNAGEMIKGRDADTELLFFVLGKLLDEQQLNLLKDKIVSVIKELPPAVGLFQVGTMLARNKDRVRIFTDDLTWVQAIDYLSAIAWPGPVSELEELFQLVHQYSDGQYQVDFDVTGQGISKKIGINFRPREKALPALMENLVKHRLCTHVKRKGVLNWPGIQGCFMEKGYGFTLLVRDVCHFKISYSPEEGIKAKAYLRVTGIYLKEVFKQKQRGYKEMQDVFKEIAKRSMLDWDYRQLCLKDSRAAIEKMLKDRVPPWLEIDFIEEDEKGAANSDGCAYVLPPFLKKSWLFNK
ncbi:hypothetical protein [Desulfofalx alkaliphila]|uniref:hypothetical protein n=1 Tax=Desulfofalx alkaliphila TaxID=105483 RepID=UPI0004E15CD9|nr:hypothetical protein [Desulfofalx alkaliphila]